MSKFDAIVIGAGNGGLTASTALAQKGLNVLLLERHNIPGGCATSFAGVDSNLRSPCTNSAVWGRLKYQVPCEWTWTVWVSYKIWNLWK